MDITFSDQKTKTPNDEEEEILSLCDFPLNSDDSEKRDSSNKRRSSSEPSEFFEFFNDFTSEMSNAEDIIFCGKLVPYNHPLKSLSADDATRFSRGCRDSFPELNSPRSNRRMLRRNSNFLIVKPEASSENHRNFTEESRCCDSFDSKLNSATSMSRQSRSMDRRKQSLNSNFLIVKPEASSENHRNFTAESSCCDSFGTELNSATSMSRQSRSMDRGRKQRRNSNFLIVKPENSSDIHRSSSKSSAKSEGSKVAKPRWFFMMFGPLKLQPEMDLQDMKNRQVRRNPGRLFAGTDAGGRIPSSRSDRRSSWGQDLLKVLSCKNHASVAVTASMGLVPHF